MSLTTRHTYIALFVAALLAGSGKALLRAQEDTSTELTQTRRELLATQRALWEARAAYHRAMSDLIECRTPAETAKWESLEKQLRPAEPPK